MTGHQKAVPIRISDATCSQWTQGVAADAQQSEGTCQSHMAPKPINHVSSGRPNSPDTAVSPPCSRALGIGDGGRLSKSSGGTTNWSSKCWSMCALKRYPLASVAMGDASARQNTAAPASTKPLLAENRKRLSLA